MMDLAFMLYAGFVCGATVVIICRAAMMTPATRLVVRAQHLVMVAGLLFGLALSADDKPSAGGACTAAGVFAWLLLSYVRWRNGPPPGTQKSGVFLTPVEE